ncbi:MAG: prepilin-type cleavage/methylation domain-containing protein [Synechococcus sp. WH 8007]|nr:prepilin-type cleavage/methylation domain-containing protein [Synechococcus sp. WH 8007]
MELLLALALGMGLFGVILQTLLAEGLNSGQLVRIWREKAFQRRSLDLMASDLRQATGISPSPDLAEPACSLAGRTPVLQLETAAGPITYSFGRAPSAIWRAQVLMRCGPAHGLDGALRAGGSTPNRVVIDGLMATAAELLPSEGGVRLELVQQFSSGGREQRIRSRRLLDLTGLERL